MKSKKSKIKPKQIVELSRLGTRVSIPLTFGEAAEIQRALSINAWGVPNKVLARLVAEFIKHPTSQRYVGTSVPANAPAAREIQRA